MFCLICIKKKLTLHRKRKTELQTKRDIAATIEDRIESYNDKGRYEVTSILYMDDVLCNRRIYGPAWDEGIGNEESFPIKYIRRIIISLIVLTECRELVSLPEHEIRALRIEAQNIITGVTCSIHLNMLE